jgi:hypothetical protein
VPREVAPSSAKLNAENVPGPRGAWAITGVREVLHRRDYKGEIITNRIQRAWDDTAEKGIRVEQPESEWKIRKDESLRIVSDALWNAAHARVAQTVKSYLRRGHQLVGKVESTKVLCLLSGFLTCGLCGKPLIATRRGRDLNLGYFCREHKERGDAGCTNATGAPAIEMHEAVLGSLRDTFSVETFTDHLNKQAGNVEAKAQRAAERAKLLAEIPELAATEQRLVRRIGTVEDDTLVAALKDEWNAVKAQRVAAERRVAELEGIERDLVADRSEVEALRETWSTWSAVLQAAIDAAPGSVPAELQAQARQIMRKIPVGSIKVAPYKVIDGKQTWTYEGHSRFDGVVLGGLTKGYAMSVRLADRSTGETIKNTWDEVTTAYKFPHPVKGTRESLHPHIWRLGRRRPQRTGVGDHSEH